MSQLRNVYVISCIENGKKYVGSTVRDCEERYSQHICNLKAKRHNVEDMQSDFDMYGESKFVLSVVGTFSEKHGRHIEYLLMHLYESRNRDCGYNYKDIAGTSVRTIKSYKSEIEILKEQSNREGVSLFDILRRTETNNCKYVIVNVDKIRKIAKSKHTNLAKIEEALDIGNGTIGKWKDRNNATVDKLYRVANYLGVKMEDLLTIVIDEKQFCGVQTYKNLMKKEAM